jgi:hypothetical protein
VSAFPQQRYTVIAPAGGTWTERQYEVLRFQKVRSLRFTSAANNFIAMSNAFKFGGSVRKHFVFAVLLVASLMFPSCFTSTKR